jgi:hypothetical protein
VKQGFNFSGNNNRFTNGNASLNINGLDNGVGIFSENGPLTLNGSDLSNNIKLGGNIDISGNFTINNVKPILTKIITSPASNDTTTIRSINTLINYNTYPSITFSGYINNDTQYASFIEFNTIKDIPTNNWFISFTPNTFSTINLRLTFFHKNLVEIDTTSQTA